MNFTEKLSSFVLALIFGLRMLGLFMVLPVFSLYATKLNMARPSLIGIALGIYGLTQAMCQIPFGMWSDKVGRKPVIVIGLLIFISGSIFAGLSHNIYGVIVGRALQGAGAIGSVVSALLADLTREEHRTKAMAIIGSIVGLAFMSAMVIGPILNTYITVSGIFMLSGGLGFVGIILLLTLVPKPKGLSFHRDAETLPALFKRILKDKELVRLDIGALVSHGILTATFVAIPISLQESAFLPEAKQGLFYLPILIVSFLAMIPLIIMAEKKRKMRYILLLAILTLVCSELLLWVFHSSMIMIAFSLMLFFTAFSFMEASLPSMISKRAPAVCKGTAMGMYSTSQYFGMFLGGVCGGLLYAHHHLTTIYIVAAMSAFLWFFYAFKMEEPRYVTSFMFRLSKNLIAEQAEAYQKSLLAQAGIIEADWVKEEGVIYLKYDKQHISEDKIIKLIQSL